MANSRIDCCNYIRLINFLSGDVLDFLVKRLERFQKQMGPANPENTEKLISYNALAHAIIAVTDERVHMARRGQTMVPEVFCRTAALGTIGELRELGFDARFVDAVDSKMMELAPEWWEGALKTLQYDRSIIAVEGLIPVPDHVRTDVVLRFLETVAVLKVSKEKVRRQPYVQRAFVELGALDCIRAATGFAYSKETTISEMRIKFPEWATQLDVLMTRLRDVDSRWFDDAFNKTCNPSPDPEGWTIESVSGHKCTLNPTIPVSLVLFLGASLRNHIEELRSAAKGQGPVPATSEPSDVEKWPLLATIASSIHYEANVLADLLPKNMQDHSVQGACAEVPGFKASLFEMVQKALHAFPGLTKERCEKMAALVPLSNDMPGSWQNTQFPSDMFLTSAIVITYKVAEEISARVIKDALSETVRMELHLETFRVMERLKQFSQIRMLLSIILMTSPSMRFDELKTKHPAEAWVMESLIREIADTPILSNEYQRFVGISNEFAQFFSQPRTNEETTEFLRSYMPGSNRAVHSLA